ncbi:MAG: peptidoglycan editing factor PgeF [Candidatus Binatia bacterium]
MEITCLRVPQWEKYNELLHGFLGRQGGRSSGPYAGLNLSFRVGDDHHVVKDNMCDMKGAVGIHSGRVVTMTQVHGDNIIDIKDRNLKEAGEADGMLTEQSGIYLGVLTADCVPILFVAPAQKVIAAVHAGWRGTMAGIAAKTVKLLLEEHSVLPSEIEVALGPSIDACCYEIGEDVSRPLIDKWDDLAGSCIQSRNRRTYLHLRNLNQAILHRAGIPESQIFQIGPCTRCAQEEFFSYRREKKETGRQISLIGWHSQ